MYCLKCGSDTKGDNVFCDLCLEDMNSCPVRPDATIHLPERPVQEIEKKPKKSRTPADQIRGLHRVIRFLLLILLIMSLLAAVLGFLLWREHKLNSASTPVIGQNYTPPETTASTE